MRVPEFYTTPPPPLSGCTRREQSKLRNNTAIKSTYSTSQSEEGALMICWKGLTSLLVLSLLACVAGAAEKPNILFIAIDDLRPELGCYGSETAVTPNLDALAKRGLLFNRTYCQQAICRPSRAGWMTGARPETTGLFHNYVSLRELQPEILTPPQHLIAHGYDTAYVGKIFHPGDNSWRIRSSWNCSTTRAIHKRTRTSRIATPNSSSD